MQVHIPVESIAVPGPNVTFSLDDNGGAHVKIVLSIEGRAPLQHDQTYQGAMSATLPLEKGKTYNCSVLIAAFKYGALNAHYDSSISANDIVLAFARGDLPPGEMSDFGFARFRVTVR